MSLLVPFFYKLSFINGSVQFAVLTQLFHRPNHVTWEVPEHIIMLSTSIQINTSVTGMHFASLGNREYVGGL